MWDGSYNMQNNAKESLHMGQKLNGTIRSWKLPPKQ